MEVNDLVPMVSMLKVGDELRNWEPVFCRPTKNEIWPMVLEKAVAKLMKSSPKIQERHGHEGSGYGMLDGGCCLFAWAMLTGSRSHGSITRGQDGTWHQLKVERLTSKSGYSGFAGKTFDGDGLFEFMSRLDKEDALIGCSMPGSPPAHAGGEPVKPNGLVMGHAYSVIQVIQCSTGHRMVQCRNPWGTDKEWKGRWCDNSRDWDSEEGRALAAELGYQPGPDGLFWMEWDDFVSEWDSVMYTKVSLERKKRKGKSSLPPSPERTSFSFWEEDEAENEEDCEEELIEDEGDELPVLEAERKGLTEDEAEAAEALGDREIEATAWNADVKAAFAGLPYPQLQAIVDRAFADGSTVKIRREGGTPPRAGSIALEVISEGSILIQRGCWG